MTEFADLANMPEDHRIEIIGNEVMRRPAGKLIGFVVEDYAKARRYCDELKARFPELLVDYSGRGPVRGTWLVRLKRADPKSN